MVTPAHSFKIKFILCAIFAVLHFSININAQSNQDFQQVESEALEAINKESLTGFALTRFNSPEKNEQVAQKIREEIKSLEPSSFLGFIRVNPQSTPTLHAFIENIAKEMEIPVPPLILVSTGVFPEQSDSALYNEAIYPILSIFQDLFLKTNAFAWSIIQRFSYITIGFDLIERLSLDELEKIVAHELAHVKHYHVPKKMIADFIIERVRVFLLYPALVAYVFPKMGEVLQKDFSTYKTEYNFLGGRTILYFSNVQPGDKDLMRMYYLVETSSKLITSLIKNFISRRFEKEADMTAVKYAKDPKKLASALEGLYEIWGEKHAYIMWFNNKIWERFFWMFDGHPALKTRVKYLHEMAKETVD